VRTHQVRSQEGDRSVFCRAAQDVVDDSPVPGPRVTASDVVHRPTAVLKCVLSCEL
jgi:hypothetical protein